MTDFKQGDFVHPIDEPTNIGVVMGIVPPGLIRVRFGTQDWAATYWPHDFVKVSQ